MKWVWFNNNHPTRPSSPCAGPEWQPATPHASSCHEGVCQAKNVRESLYKTYAVLCELQSTLVLANAEQLHCPLLIGGKANNLTDHIPNKLDTLAEALPMRIDLEKPTPLRRDAFSWAGNRFVTWPLARPYATFPAFSTAATWRVMAANKSQIQCRSIANREVKEWRFRVGEWKTIRVSKKHPLPDCKKTYTRAVKPVINGLIIHFDNYFGDNKRGRWYLLIMSQEATFWGHILARRRYSCPFEWMWSFFHLLIIKTV